MKPKFRAWDKEGHRMILPKYLHSIDLLEEQVTERTKCNYTFSLHSIPFDRVELMQSTGLFDRNGKEIFEGDIIKRYRSPFFEAKWEYQIETVIKEEASLLLGREHGKNFGTIPFNSPFAQSFLLEVIGNVHENPELLEEEE